VIRFTKVAYADCIISSNDVVFSSALVILCLLAGITQKLLNRISQNLVERRHEPKGEMFGF